MCFFNTLLQEPQKKKRYTSPPQATTKIIHDQNHDQVDSTHAVSYFVATLVAMAFVVLEPQKTPAGSTESWKMVENEQIPIFFCLFVKLLRFCGIF